MGLGLVSAGGFISGLNSGGAAGGERVASVIISTEIGSKSTKIASVS